MNTLVFGKTGQVAHALQQQTQVTALDRHSANLNDPVACAEVIRARRPDVVINAAAYTAVDKAEDESDLAQTINAAAPGAMALACKELDIPFLHISTDYVFDGSGNKPWDTNATIAPASVYGRTKAAGEEKVREAGGRHVILRTSWVFSNHGNNFVRTMLRLSESRDTLNVVDDQIGGPTPAKGIAAALLTMAQAMLKGQGGGTYHYAGTPATNWKCFARETFALAGRDVTVNGIPTADYPTPATRPLNSRLNCSTLTADFGITPPDWKADLATIVSDLLQ